MMSFELANASATFQTLINKTLHDLINHICVIYLDNILIYFKTKEKHWKFVNEILEKLQTFDLYIKLSKYKFCVTSVNFLNYIVDNNKIFMNPSKIEAIKSWPIPKNLKQLQVFLNFTNFYRRFVVLYAKMSRPLSDLLRDNKNEKQVDPFLWNKKAAQTFKKLIALFTSAPMLIHFDPKRKILIKTNASDFAITKVISQLVKLAQHPKQ